MAYASSRRRMTEGNAMKWLCVLLAIPLFGCSTPMRVEQDMLYAGGDGSCCEQAVVINGAKYRETGLMGQRLWLQKRFPGYRQVKEQVVEANRKRFDQVELTTADGQNSSVYFDVTDWWGK